MIEIMPDMPDEVLAVSAKGTVTGEDYENVLVPTIEEKLKRHQKIRMLYHLGREFSSFTAGAMWDDAKIGMRRLTAFEKIAVVTDVEWITGAARFFAFLIPCPVRVFHNDKLSEAKNWVSQDAP